MAHDTVGIEWSHDIVYYDTRHTDVANRESS
jgi:hypothetical protein